MSMKNENFKCPSLADILPEGENMECNENYAGLGDNMWVCLKSELEAGNKNCWHHINLVDTPKVTPNNEEDSTARKSFNCSFEIPLKAEIVDEVADVCELVSNVLPYFSTIPYIKRKNDFFNRQGKKWEVPRYLYPRLNYIMIPADFGYIQVFFAGETEIYSRNIFTKPRWHLD